MRYVKTEGDDLLYSPDYHTGEWLTDETTDFPVEAVEGYRLLPDNVTGRVTYLIEGVQEYPPPYIHKGKNPVPTLIDWRMYELGQGIIKNGKIKRDTILMSSNKGKIEDRFSFINATAEKRIYRQAVFAIVLAGEDLNFEHNKAIVESMIYGD